jgi:hypothetical protein
LIATFRRFNGTLKFDIISEWKVVNCITCAINKPAEEQRLQIKFLRTLESTSKGDERIPGTGTWVHLLVSQLRDKFVYEEAG